MNRDAAIENWLASMSESELIAQCFFWHDMALEHGHMYNVVNAENAKLREACAELLVMAEQYDPEWLHWPEMHEELRKLGVEVTK